MAAAPPESRPGTASLPVRPVTARTWQALMTEDAPKQQVSLYTNDLFGQLPHDSPSGDVPSPCYQPTSARSSPSRPQQQQQQHIRAGAAPGVPSPRQVASPSRLGSGGSGGPPTSTQDGNVVLGLPGRSSASLLADSSASLQRPSTAPVGRPSPLRTSAIALSALSGAAAAGGSGHGAGGSQGRPGTPFQPVISLDSPRLKQLLGQGFAPAVPASTSSPTSGSLSGAPPATGDSPAGSLRQQWSAAAARPATPSFQPLSTSPAQPTSSAGAAPAAAVDFTIRTSFHATDKQQRQQQLVPSGRPLGSYPTPPATAPAKAAGRLLALGAGIGVLQQQQQSKTGFALYGISPAAFVLAGPSTSGPALPLQPPLLAMALASAALASGATLRAFLLSPGPADLPLQCRIMRSRGGLFKGGSQYRLVLEGPGGASAGGRVLLAARKRTGAPAGARYDVSCSPDDFSRRGPGLCARLRSNFLGTEFSATAAGEGVGEGPGSGGGGELVAVAYQPNVLGTKGPRRMTALIPRLAPGGGAPAATPARGEAESLLGRYRAYDLSGCVVLRNKPPRWNEGLGAYCLSFGGRVTRASVKNFQLVAVDNMERVVLQFGKVSDEAFTMDLAWPMTPLQAFAICLTSFDSKLACE